MGNWGDDTDPEVQALKEYDARFTINFKKLYIDVDELVETTMEINEKHPKDSLLKLWAGAMTGMFILFCLSYHVLIIATVVFMAFYLIAIFRIGKAWKGFNYKPWKYWFMTLGTLIASGAVAVILQTLVMGK